MAKGVQISDRVDVQSILQTAVAPQQGFAKNVFIIDADEVPVDRRVVEVTKGDYADKLDSTGLPYAYANTHFSQKRTPDSLLIARWAKTATDVYDILGASWVQVLATWKAITDGEFSVYEVATPANSDDISACNFSGCTDITQVWDVINLKLASLSTPTITDLDSAEFSIDVFGRILLTIPTSGSTAPTIAIGPVSGGTGTDLATLMDYTEQTPVAGLDAETITDAIDAIMAKDNTGYFITAKFDNVKETKATEISAFCAKIEAMEKIGIVLSDDPLTKDPSDTTNIFYLMKQLGYKRTAGIYYESIASRETMFPDSAGLGAVMPAIEGTTKFCQEEIVGVGVSGYTSPLSKSESDAVNGHGGNVVELVGGVTYWFDGLTFGGEEIRIMLGRDWFVTRIREDIFNYTIAQPFTGYDNETLSAIAGFIRNRGEQAITRRIGVDTALRPFTVNMPDEDAFTAAERGTHVLEALEVFQLYLNSSANEYKITGLWTL